MALSPFLNGVILGAKHWQKKRKNLWFRLCIMTSGLQCFCLWRRTHRERNESWSILQPKFHHKNVELYYFPPPIEHNQISLEREILYTVVMQNIEWRLGETGATWANAGSKTHKSMHRRAEIRGTQTRTEWKTSQIRRKQWRIYWER